MLGQGGLVCCTYLRHHMFVACRAVAGFDSYVQVALLSFTFFFFLFSFPHCFLCFVKHHDNNVCKCL